ncbi:MAG TPA: GerMN domain-containing protein [Cerasibacillus sp.]|uniref:GerMN domain-containing protein n=1 Tax=Cerasibacillus sp. TaxID=2498711 RepID=UPI002F41140E
MHKRIYLSWIILIILIILTGCFKGEQTMGEIDPPNEAETVEKNDNLSEETKPEDKESHSTTVARELYLIDANGMVAPQTVELPFPESKEVAKQVLEYLVRGGPITPLLPNGFQAVLPEGTEVLGLTLQDDGTMVVDLSEEFKNYEAKDEQKILQAMTYTLTQFDQIKKIKIWLNGHPLDEMPVDGTPISEGYSRANGINIIHSEVADLLMSEAVTLHFPAEYNNTRYYVPVTKYVGKSDTNLYESVVNSLLNGPGHYANLIHVFNLETSLVDSPVLEDGILKLVFSEDILKNKDQAMISDEVMETLVRSLTELDEVEGVDIKVENMEKLVNENGESLNTPVMKGKEAKQKVS